VSDLPQTWTDCRLGDVVDYGLTRKCEPVDILGDSWVLELEDIEKGTSRLLDRQTFAQRQSKSTKNCFDAGDVLYGKLRPYLNKVLIADQPGYCTTEIVPLKAEAHLDARYLFYWLKHPTFLAYVEAESHGLNMPRLGTDTGRAAPFVFAPRPEQTRIADKLDAVLARVDACRNRLNRIPAILKRFRQSVLAAATSGALTEDLRDANPHSGTGADQITRDLEAKTTLLQSAPALAKKKSSSNSGIDTEYVFPIPESWNFTSWGALSEWITYGFTRPMPSAPSGVKLVTARDVLNFSLRLAEAGFTTGEAYADLSDKDRPRRGDLLITKDGTIGRAAIVATDEPFCINQSVAVCWLRSTSMDREYLELVANADFTQTFVQEKAKGMAIQHLSITDFAQAPVPVPPPAEQAEIVRRVETLFAFADRLEARYTAARAQVEKLTPSLLAKAFRGELVPQDPNDEPASELLARIRVNVASQPKRGRGRKTAAS